jgi:hypothetical protein
MCNNILTKCITGIIIMVMIIGSGIFSGCQKENDSKRKNISEETLKQQKGYLVSDDIIADLSTQTGIDIEQLSQQPYIADIVSAFLPDWQILLSQPVLSQSAINEIGELVENIKMAEETGNDAQVFALFEQFSVIMNNNGGFYHNNETFGLQNHSYNGHIYNLPVNYMNVLHSESVLLWESICNDYTSVQNMDLSVQREILEKAILLELERRDLPMPGLMSGQALADCLSSAGVNLTAALTAATVSYMLGLISCAPIAFPPLLGACMIFYTGLYAVAVVSAYSTYKTSVENCQLKYGS